MKKVLVLILIIIISCSPVLNIKALGSVSVDDSLKDEILDYDYIYDAKKDERIPIPKTYVIEKVIKYLGEEAGFFKRPEYIFIDNKQFIYVADTGNNRIVKLSNNGEVVNIFTGPSELPFNKPSGVFVDNDGAIFVSDTGNNRIVHLNSAGEYVDEFVRPESELLEDDFVFNPKTVYISPTGYIYCIRHQSLMTIDVNNNFRGYVGTTEVGFDLAWFLVRIFATKEQRRSVIKKQAPPFTNFVITDEGEIYATTQDIRYGQIKKINSVGRNLYPPGQYGEKDYDKKNNIEIQPYLADITVNEKGIISVLQQNNGRVYQYDQEGNMLASFGGIGERRGQFKMPVSLTIDSEGCIYVLDKELECIQVFKPTRYIELIHEGIYLYHDGKYLEAQQIWREVLSINNNYKLAHMGLGKSLMKDEQWKAAMEEYKAAGDKLGYSSAFVKYRYTFIRKNFGWILLVVGFAVYLLNFIIRSLKKLSDDVIDTFGQEKGGNKKYGIF